MTSLKAHLGQKASDYAHRAIEAYVEERMGDFALFAGTALELAIKAKLAGINPTFLAPAGKRGFESAISFHRAAEDVARLSPSVRSVTATDALERLTTFDKSLGELLNVAEVVTQVRNSEAHIGLRERMGDDKHLAAFTQAIGVLLNIDAQQFWGNHFSTIEHAVGETRSAIEQEVDRKIAAAYLRFKRRFDDADSHAVSTFRSTIELSRDEAVDYNTTAAVDCPGCRSPALATGSAEEDVDVDYDDGVPFVSEIVVEFYATGINCVACGLHLTSTAEILAAEQPTRWTLDVPDIDDWLARRYECDEY